MVAPRQPGGLAKIGQQLNAAARKLAGQQPTVEDAVQKLKEKA